MYKNLILFALGLVLVAGCGGSGDGNGSAGTVGSVACGSGNSPYLGCWRTIGCQPVQNPYGSDPVWGINRYNFASDGKIYEQGAIYSNSNCTGATLYEWDQFTDFAFTDMGSETLASGPTGYRLNVEDVTTNGQGTTEVLVAVINNQLCLSSSFQLASANSYALFFDQTPTDVDYNNCLDPS